MLVVRQTVSFKKIHRQTDRYTKGMRLTGSGAADGERDALGVLDVPRDGIDPVVLG